MRDVPCWLTYLFIYQYSSQTDIQCIYITVQAAPTEVVLSCELLNAVAFI